MSALIPTGVFRLNPNDVYGVRPCASCGRNWSEKWCTNCAIHDVGDLHKENCEARQRLGKAVRALHQAWKLYQEATNFKKYRVTHEDQNKIYLKEFKPSDEDLLTGASAFTTADENVEAGFQSHVTPRAQMALRNLDNCWQPSSVAAPLVHFMLQHVGSVSQVACHVKNIAVVLYHNSEEKTSTGHNVLCIELPNEDSFAIDLTGAQYGWEEILTPWPAYMRNRIEVPLSWSSVPAKGVMNGWYEAHFAALAHLRGRVAREAAFAGEAYLKTAWTAQTMEQFLDLPNDKFADCCCHMMHMIKCHIYLVMEEIYEQGLGRWYYNGESAKIPLSEAMAWKCLSMWMPLEEVKRMLEDGEETEWLLDAWRSELMGEEQSEKLVNGIEFGSD